MFEYHDRDRMEHFREDCNLLDPGDLVQVEFETFHWYTRLESGFEHIGCIFLGHTFDEVGNLAFLFYVNGRPKMLDGLAERIVRVMEKME